MSPTIAWLILICAAASETIWASALSDRNRRLFGRVAQFLIGTVLSMGGLGLALTAIPVAVAYAVWVGIGAVTTFTYSALRGCETVTVARMSFIFLILAGSAGLKAVS